MNRRYALKLLLGCVATAISTPAFAAPEVTVWHSPD